MAKVFNVNGACRPDRHYMVSLGPRLESIKEMVDAGEYFTINRARQYGKTTTLRALADYLKEDYIVVSMDFQRMGASKFKTENIFSVTFAQDFIKRMRAENGINREALCPLGNAVGEKGDTFELYELFGCLSDVCARADRPIVLIIDEVDTATNNQVFVDFLAQLRASYLDSDMTPTFQSVILAGVYDVRDIILTNAKIFQFLHSTRRIIGQHMLCRKENLSVRQYKRRLRPDEGHKENSPWNIAADFEVEMGFSISDIAGMLGQYEEDYHTGMDVDEISGLLYAYTSGYPYLVSRLCKLMDEKIVGTEAFGDKKEVWTKSGVLEAVKRLLSEKNPLFESLVGKLEEYPGLKNMIYMLLFQGRFFFYNADEQATDMLLMFGFIKVEHETVQIANRIFETRLYNYFLTLPEVQNGDMYRLASWNKSQYIQNGHLDMERILAKFVEHFDDVYGDRDNKFLEEDGRRYFMLYLKPIINGTGNYYVESRTRNQERTDLIIDYQGAQFIVEMKVWRGNAYNERGEDGNRCEGDQAWRQDID